MYLPCFFLVLQLVLPVLNLSLCLLFPFHHLTHLPLLPLHLQFVCLLLQLLNLLMVLLHNLLTTLYSNLTILTLSPVNYAQYRIDRNTNCIPGLIILLYENTCTKNLVPSSLCCRIRNSFSLLLILFSLSSFSSAFLLSSSAFAF